MTDGRIAEKQQLYFSTREYILMAKETSETNRSRPGDGGVNENRFLFL
jgi:hypothetical protein